MGYSLRVGELTGPVWNREVLPASSEQAPDGPNGQSNQCQPSYGYWADFCRAVGLYDLFYGDLMPDHPGIARLTARHQQAISEARRRYMQANPQAQPRYDGSTEDGYLAWLTWLDWWATWAFTNCRRAGVANR